MAENLPQYPIAPEARPMGPLLEGDQAIIDAAERIPIGGHEALNDEGRQIADTVRGQLNSTVTVAIAAKRRNPKVIAEISPDGIAVADDDAGLVWLSEENRLSKSGADSEPVLPHKEAQKLKVDIAKKIGHIATVTESADRVISVPSKVRGTQYADWAASNGGHFN